MHGRFSRLPQSEIAGSLMLRYSTSCQVGLNGITWRNHDQSREGSQNRKVFGRMVAHTKTPIRQASPYRDHFYIRTVIADIIADLLQASQGREVGNRVGENDLSAERHARRDA